MPKRGLFAAAGNARQRARTEAPPRVLVAEPPAETQLQPLHLAALVGDRDAVVRLLDAGVAAAPALAATTPLHLAALRDRRRVIRTLLVRGASVRHTDAFGRTPVFMAALGGHAAAALDLVRYGVSLETVGRDAPAVRRALYEVVNKPAKGGFTALHVAAQFGFVDVIGQLVALGADINARTDSGRNALHLAVMSGRLGAVERILAHAHRISSARPGARYALVSDCDDGGRTALHLAVLHNHAEMVGALLVAGCNPNVPCRDGRRPIDYATSATRHFLREDLARVTLAPELTQ